MYRTKYSRMEQEKFVEDNLQNLKWYGFSSADHTTSIFLKNVFHSFTWSTLEYFVPYEGKKKALNYQEGHCRASWRQKTSWATLIKGFSCAIQKQVFHEIMKMDPNPEHCQVYLSTPIMRADSAKKALIVKRLREQLLNLKIHVNNHRRIRRNN